MHFKNVFICALNAYVVHFYVLNAYVMHFYVLNAYVIHFYVPGMFSLRRFACLRLLELGEGAGKVLRDGLS